MFSDCLELRSNRKMIPSSMRTCSIDLRELPQVELSHVRYNCPLSLNLPPFSVESRVLLVVRNVFGNNSGLPLLIRGEHSHFLADEDDLRRCSEASAGELPAYAPTDTPTSLEGYDRVCS